MRCPHCQRDHRIPHPTCTDCGRALTVPCAECGQTNRALARFCAQCARPLQPLRAELKYVTVLFADIRNSTALIAGVDPEDADERMGPAVAAMREAVRRHSGSVNRIAGDGLMALFGAPLGREDHAHCACVAAQEIVSAVAACSRSEISVRVGLHSGNVLLRPIENDFSTDYDAIGDTPHVAHRMESMAGENEILMTGDTFRLAEGFVRAEPLGLRPVAGLDAPMKVFRLLDATLQEDRWRARASRGLTEFIGRERELGVLLAQLEQARQGDCRVVEIVGDAGLGKSRLTHELCQAARKRGWSVWTAAAQPGDPLNAYRPLARLIRACLEAKGEMDPADLTERLRTLGEQRSEISSIQLAALASVLGLPIQEVRWKEIDPPERRRHTIESVAELIRTSSLVAPHLLLLEDLHWADEETLSALATVIDRTRGPVLIITTRRPTLHSRSVATRPVQIELGPIERSASLSILDGLMGTHSSLTRLKAQLIDRAGGNPLFLEESVRSLEDSHTLSGERACYFLERRVDGHLIPASLYGVVATRVDCLDTPVKRCVQLASVIGRHVALPILRGLYDGEGDVQAHLGVLDHLGLLLSRHPAQPSSLGHRPETTPEACGEPARDRSYAFKHALIQEVVYHSIPRRERERLHAEITSLLESLDPSILADHLDDLAYHAARGNLWAKAARYRLRICIRAQEQATSRELVAMLEGVMSSFASMPQEPQILKASIDLRLVTCNALLPLGEHARLIEVLAQAEHMASALGDTRRLGTVYNQQSLALWLSGEYEAMSRTTTEAARLARSTEHTEIGLSARFMSGVLCHARGRYADAVAELSEFLSGFDGDRESTRSGWSAYPVLSSRMFLIDALLQLGRQREAGHHAQYAWALGDRIGHPYSQALARSSVVLWLLAEKRAKDAVSLAEDTRRLCERHHLLTMNATVAARSAAAYLQHDDLDAALGVLHPALDPQVYERSAAWTQVDLFRVAAEANLIRGDIEQAHQHAQKAERFCRDHRAEGQLAHVLLVSAGVEAAREEPDLAVERLRESLEIAQELHMIELASRVRRLRDEIG